MNEQIHTVNEPNDITRYWLNRMHYHGQRHGPYRTSLRNAGTMRMDETHMQLLSVLPPNEEYPIERRMSLAPYDSYSPYDNTQHTWKYFQVTYINQPFVLWARDGRIRIDPLSYCYRAIASRLNLLLSRGYHPFRNSAIPGTQGRHGFCNFTSHRRRVHYRFHDGSMLPVTKGDVFDTNTFQVHSRLLAGKPPLTSLTADIDSCPISADRLQLFRQAPLNPSIRSAIRSETNVVLPDTVTDESSLQTFFRQQRMIVSEEGVWAV